MLLLDTTNNECYAGYILEQLLDETGMVSYDLEKRQVSVGKHLAREFTDEFTQGELKSEMRKSALLFFTNQLHWKLFTESNHGK